MSLFKGSLRSPTIWSDEAIERYLTALRAEVEIDPLRVQILPDRFHPELAAYALPERIGEMGRLAAAGDSEGVAGLAATIEAGYLELLAIDPAGTDAALHQYFVVLDRLLERLPEGARSAIQTTIDRAAEARGGAPGSGSTGDGRGPGDRPDDDASSGGSTDRDTSPTSTRSLKPQSTPRAHDPASSYSTPKATKSPKPDGS
ncbi:MAG: hypothetical protein H0X68_11185 [Chloroflexi bacterium]|nr:hypothetical protein [Chloroflexota bacterium]